MTKKQTDRKKKIKEGLGKLEKVKKEHYHKIDELKKEGNKGVEIWEHQVDEIFEELGVEQSADTMKIYSAGLNMTTLPKEQMIPLIGIVAYKEYKFKNNL